MAMLEGGEEHWAIWKYVPAMIKDGRQDAFLREFSQMAFDRARSNPDVYGAVFGKAMSGFSAIQSPWTLEARLVRTIDAKQSPELRQGGCRLDDV